MTKVKIIISIVVFFSNLKITNFSTTYHTSIYTMQFHHEPPPCNMHVSAAATKIPFMYSFSGNCSAGLRPNFHIHVSVRDLYIPRIGSHISCSRIGISILRIYKTLTDTGMWKLGLWPSNSFSGNICFNFSVLVLCSAG